MTTTIFMGSSQQLQNGISFFLHRMEYPVQVKILLIIIRFTESALEEGSEEGKELHKNVKRVMEIIVGLLKDRVNVEKEPVMKKQRVQGISKNKSDHVY